MTRLAKRTSKKVGLPPGTLVHVGKKKARKVRMTLIDYDEEHFEEREVSEIEDCFPFKDLPTVTWINIDGLHRADIVEALGSYYGLHPLVMEDIMSTGQRPKLEDYDGYIFVVLRMLGYAKKTRQIEDEQVSLILGPNFVISFQEREGDAFDPVRERIRTGKGRMRKMGPDYLAYALADAIVDHYFLILEHLGEDIERLEGELVTDPKAETLQAIHTMKREIIYLRRSVWPLREVVSRLQRGESPLIKDTTLVYLRDVYDHTVQVIDTVESLRDVVSGMLDTYLSSISNRMNEVMKVLTIIATIFIPLSFIAGLYGMNFVYIPELLLPWGYFMALAVMATIGLVMVYYFRRRAWI